MYNLRQPARGPVEVVSLTPGVPLLLGYVCRADRATLTVASQTTITLHAPDDRQKQL
ncbi:hypothetical protein JYU34_006503 [Plutella xylostella]|uniref:Uncharacterized protein n=1 Tax=Plutella xylostella TaxID=51655 RepID=A0ABQ7QS48_PLUXY|nr:hypothetical protein JYU34_006503 [Plutella xylostella]